MERFVNVFRLLGVSLQIKFGDFKDLMNLIINLGIVYIFL